MTWSLRDYKNSTGKEPDRIFGDPPPATMDDSAPLPTYAAGLEDDHLEARQPLWHQRIMEQQGFATPEQLTRFGNFMRRGIPAIFDAPAEEDG